MRDGLSGNMLVSSWHNLVKLTVHLKSLADLFVDLFVCNIIVIYALSNSVIFSKSSVGLNKYLILNM